MKTKIIWKKVVCDECGKKCNGPGGLITHKRWAHTPGGRTRMLNSVTRSVVERAAKTRAERRRASLLEMKSQEDSPVTTVEVPLNSRGKPYTRQAFIKRALKKAKRGPYKTKTPDISNPIADVRASVVCPNYCHNCGADQRAVGLALGFKR